MNTDFDTILEYERIKGILEQKGLLLAVGYWDIFNRPNAGKCFHIYLSKEDYNNGNPFTSCLDIGELRGVCSGMMLQENLVLRIKENL